MTSKKPPGFPQGAFPISKASELAVDPEILRRAFTIAAANEFKLHALPLVQAVQPGFFNSRDVHKRIGAAAFHLNEAKSLGSIEPFNSSGLQLSQPLFR